MKSIILPLLLMVIGINTAFADNANDVLKKLNIKLSFFYETAFAEQCFDKISDSKIISAGIAYRSNEMNIDVFSLNHYFLIKDNNINMFGTTYQLFTSPEFLKTVRKDFKINSKEEAAIFQDLLCLIDQQCSWTSFFMQENDWYFIRKTFFEDIEAWKISTDKNGVITSINFSDKMQVTIPEVVYEISSPSREYEKVDEYIPTDKHLQQIQNLINEKISYIESAEDLKSENFSTISDASFYRFSFSLKEEIIDEEDGNYTSSHNQVFDGLVFNENLSIFYDFNELLSSEQFLESIKPTFLLLTESDANVFEAFLDEHSNYMRSKKNVLFKDNTWYFVRDDSFEDKVGFAVKVDNEGRILAIEYSYQLAIEITEQEFDEATADWGFSLISPESSSIEVVEGIPINYIVEFNEKPVSKVGAWILTNFDGQNNSMYAGTELYSPYHGEISGEAITPGKHNLDIYLMRPGMNLETAIETASVEINVVPFNDVGVQWNFSMDEPKSNTVISKHGESVPVVLSYNADEANRLGVRIDIYFEGELVGGQKPPYHQSPFAIDIPGSELKKGSNKVSFVFAGGDKELAKFEVNVEVK
jgi:hypothetical protein